ncbi:MAG: hypothetical protein OXD48_13295 [Litoreibacter sp.]|nr:hypothetical protein [Litoreibacter sp.]
MRKAFGIVLSVVLVLPVIGFVAFKATEIRYLKGFVPPAYGHVDLEDKTTLVAGFGPGGHDAVLAFFHLSEEVASLMAAEGVVWLHDAETSVELRRSTQADEWITTPLTGEVYSWAYAANCSSEIGDWWLVSHTDHTCPGISAFLRGYGFLDELSVSKTELVDEILQSEGSFISRRRVGYLIVAPERSLVIFAHAG